MSINEDSESWVDSVISRAVESHQLDICSVLRLVLAERRFSESQAKQALLQYSLSTMYTVLSQELTQDREQFISALARGLVQVILDPPIENGFQSLYKWLKGEVEGEGGTGSSGIVKRIIQEFMAYGQFTEANLFIAEFQQFTFGIDLYKQELLKTQDNSLAFIARKSLFLKYLDCLDTGAAGTLLLDDVLQLSQDKVKQRLVVVELNAGRRLEDGVFYVDSLQAGLQLCKAGGILYLRNGDYCAPTPWDVCLTNANGTLEVIGESCSDCSISGSLRIMSANQIIFRNIKFEIGDSAESIAAVNIFSGEVVFESCIIESFVNTAIYLHGIPNTDKITGLSLRYCIVEGLQSCQRVFSVEQGGGIQLSVESCYFNESYSVLSCFQDTLPGANVSLSFSNCAVNDVQDGVRIVLSEFNRVNIHIECCSFNLVLYSEESPSAAVTVFNIANMQVRNSLVELNHTQGYCIQASNVGNVSVIGSIFCTAGQNQIDRRLSTSTCTALFKVAAAHLSNNSCSGFRVGLDVKDSGHLSINKSTFSECSLGMYTSKNSSSEYLSVEDVAMNRIFNAVLLEGCIKDAVLRRCLFTDVLLPLAVNSGNVRTEVCTQCYSQEIQGYMKTDCSGIERLELRDDKSAVEEALHQQSRTKLDKTSSKLDSASVQTGSGRQLTSGSSKAKVSIADLEEEDEDETDKISEDDLKLFLIVQKNLPYQTALDHQLVRVVPIQFASVENVPILL